MIFSMDSLDRVNSLQGGRSWQPFGEGKNARISFRQARICYFRDKGVVFERNGKISDSV